MPLPPPPIADPSGSFAWLEWYRQLREYVSQTGSVPWAVVDKSGSKLSDIVTRTHNTLQSIQGGMSGSYYHLTATEHAALSNTASGTYTPTLTNVTNVTASTAYQCQYVRLGSIVTVSGKVDVDPTGAGAVQLGISLPVASNFANNQECAGTAATPAVAYQSAAVVADTANDRAEMQWIAVDTANRTMFFTFTYQVI